MTDSDTNLYQIKNLSFSYSLGKQTVPALKNLDLEIPSSSLITISGPSGSGKSTLLNILGLIEPPQQGSVLFQDEDIANLSESKKNSLRKTEIGFIFQHFHLIPVLTAEENVEYFLVRNKLPKQEIKRRSEEALRAVGLWEHRKKRPNQMSGGQMQRVAIARAIAKSPVVIIGDEPTASLDQKTGYEIMQVLKNLAHTSGCSIILTTHDAMVQSFADLNIHIQDGMLSETTKQEAA